MGYSVYTIAPLYSPICPLVSLRPPSLFHSLRTLSPANKCISIQRKAEDSVHTIPHYIYRYVLEYIYYIYDHV